MYSICTRSAQLLHTLCMHMLCMHTLLVSTLRVHMLCMHMLCMHTLMLSTHEQLPYSDLSSTEQLLYRCTRVYWTVVRDSQLPLYRS